MDGFADADPLEPDAPLSQHLTGQTAVIRGG